MCDDAQSGTRRREQCGRILMARLKEILALRVMIENNDDDNDDDMRRIWIGCCWR